MSSVPSTSELRLQRVTKGTKHDLGLFAEGASIERALGMTIAEARKKAAADRIVLACEFIDVADRVYRARPPQYRLAINRYYYGMYHAMRAVAFENHGGDDFENHTVLQKGIPSDFPHAATARNDLRDARLRRNEADYEPYPSDSRHYRSGATQLAQIARQFVDDACAYLKSKGNPHL